MPLSGRLQTKHRLMVMSNRMCEWCGQSPASDMHEIVSRSMTRKGSLARKLSYDEHLCCVLCRECHSKAHGHDGRAALLRVKIKRHGPEVVLEALAKVGASMVRKLPVGDDLDDE